MKLTDPKAMGYANAIVAMLAAGIDGAASFREPINGVFCHVFGLVTRSDQRALDKYKKSAPLSKYAAANPDEPRVFEHVVPMAVIYRELTQLPKPDACAVIALIARLYRVRRVTKSEDARLTTAGLRHVMPEAYYDSGHPLFGDIEARHKWVGIEAEAQ
ncbi:hypothetical protein [Shewanella sp. GXUN23E]|uniref:hypothetical protein n=1 Tax=Shewanella sp. GXUN23E TaxID=3422498 RepID=UPI003D7D95D1